ncbi:MAG: SDR family NAD(P)-dependent oxidoreductase [Ilumatobacteraceae bacterium]
MDSFDGKVAVITGGASGIGLALARSFTREGAHVVIGDVDAAALTAVGSELPDAVTALVDVADAVSVEALGRTALDAFGGVDIICANAGITGPTGRRLWEVTRPEWDNVIGVNLIGVINAVHTFVPLLLERPEGHVLITASMAGLTRASVLPCYWATKHALVAIGESLQTQFEEEAPTLGVSVLTPGGVRTNLGQSRTDADDAQTGVPGRSDRVIEADECADITLDTIRRGGLYVITHPEGIIRVESRFAVINDAFADAAARIEV